MHIAVMLGLIALFGALSETDAIPTTGLQRCNVRGVWYNHGDRTGDRCNRCWCSNGLELCNRMACPPSLQRCNVRGVWYNHGDRTGDRCNRCWCSNGLELCNRMACPPSGLPLRRYTQ